MRSRSVLFAMLLVAAPAGPAVLAEGWVRQEQVISSQSPYPNNMQYVPYPVRVPGAVAIRVFFEYVETEPQWDRVEIYDTFDRLYQRVSGMQGRFWSATVPGDTLVIKMTTDYQRSGRGFLVTAVEFQAAAPQPIPVAPSTPLARVVLHTRQGAGWAPLDPRIPIPLHVGGCVHSSFEFLVRGYDAYGREIAGFLYTPQLRFSLGGTPFASLDPLGNNIYRFRAGGLTASGLHVWVYDVNLQGIEFDFYVDLYGGHACVSPGGPVVVAPAPASYWQAVGSTWQQPWAAPNQTVGVDFSVDHYWGTLTRYRYVPNAATRIFAIRADFVSGGSQMLTAGDFYLNPGQEYVFDVTGLVPGDRIWRLKFTIQAPQYSLHQAYVLVPR